MCLDLIVNETSHWQYDYTIKGIYNNIAGFFSKQEKYFLLPFYGSNNFLLPFLIY